MKPKNRQTTSLSFLGWSVKGDELRVLTRMTVFVERKGWQQVGPILHLAVPTDFLLQDDVMNSANTAWEAREKREARIQQELLDARQARLF